MLILTRRVGETLMIGDQVSVTVLGVKGNQVRIGINAPRMWPCIVKRSTSASRARATKARPLAATEPPVAQTFTCQGVAGILRA